MLDIRQRPDLPDMAKVMELADTSLSKGIVSDGPLCREFEKQLADYCGYKYCSVVSSGTVALMYAFRMAMDIEIDLPSFTWISTANAIWLTGNTPSFRDVHDDTWTIDASSEEGAICPVWPFGIRPTQEALTDHGGWIIGDCAQALGSDITGCDIACLSFSYSKVLTTGEGGCCLCNDPEIDRDIRELRDNGKLGPDQWGDIECKSQGWTGRLTEIQAAMGIVGMENLEANLEKRVAITCRYVAGFGELFDCSMQKFSPNHSYFPLRTTLRDKYWSALREAGIDARKYFSPCHKMAAYDTGQSLPVTEKLAQEVLCLPIYAGMPDKDVDYVIQKVREILG